MAHVFLSYVHEDIRTVRKIRGFLENMDISVWIDNSSILGGEQWKESIRKGVKEATFFIACFSKNYAMRETTFMDEELAIAIDALHDRSKDDSWFVPIRLNEYHISNNHILPNRLEETLLETQYIDLFPDISVGLIKLAEVVVPKLNPIGAAKGWFEPAVEQHIHNKITHFKRMGANVPSKIRAKWNGVLKRHIFNPLLTEFGELFRRATSTQEPQLGWILDPAPTGIQILLSIVPHRNIAVFLKSLSPKRKILGHNYLDFIIEKRDVFRSLPNWENRDFAHIMYFDGQDEVTVDMLYLENTNLSLAILEQFLKSKHQEPQSGKKIGMPMACMYPTSIISAIEVGALRDRLLADDIKFLKS